MNPADLQSTTAAETRHLISVNRGWLGGCEVYASKNERFSLRSGVYERELKHRFETMMAGTDLFLDVGAGEGFFSCCLLRRTDARVVAFESGESRAAVLKDNVERNSAPSCDRWTFAGDHRGHESAVVSLDAIAEEGADSVLLKIDAPGDEVALLTGAAKILDDEETRVLIRLYGREHQAACMSILDEHGFSVELVGPAWWRPFVPDLAHQESACWLVAEKQPFEMLLS